MIGSIGFCKVKYKVLDNILLEKEQQLFPNSESIVLAVDLKSFIRKAYRTNEQEIFYNKDSIADLTSEFMNIPVYYKNYLIKHGRKKVYIVYLYSESKCDILLKKYPDYKKYYYDKYFGNSDFKELNEITHSSVGALKILSRYMPFTSYINTSSIDDISFFDKLVEFDSAAGIPTLILSNDLAIYSALDRNSMALHMSGDDSAALLSTDVASYICDLGVSFSANLLPLLFAISDVHLYSLKKVPRIGYKTGAKILNDLMAKHLIFDMRYYSCPDNLFMYKQLSQYKQNIITNYEVIYPKDIEIFNNVMLKASLKLSEFEGSADAFADLNTKNFRQFPIDIEMMFAKAEK